MEVAAHDDAEIGSSNPGTISGLSASVSSGSSSSSSKGSSSSSNKGSSSSSSSSSSSRRKIGSKYHNAIGRPDFAYTNNKRKVPAWKDDLKRKVLARAKKISGDAGASTLTASLPLIGAAIACSMPAMGSGVSYTQANVLSSISPTICSSTATSTSLACKRKHSCGELRFCTTIELTQAKTHTIIALVRKEAASGGDRQSRELRNDTPSCLGSFVSLRRVKLITLLG